MTKHLVVYLKVHENKTGVHFDGPFIGPESNDLDTINSKIKEIVEKSKSGLVVTKIYEMDDVNDHIAIMERAKKFFTKYAKAMMESKKINNKAK